MNLIADELADVLLVEDDPGDALLIEEFFGPAEADPDPKSAKGSRPGVS